MQGFVVGLQCSVTASLDCMTTARRDLAYVQPLPGSQEAVDQGCSEIVRMSARWLFVTGRPCIAG